MKELALNEIGDVSGGCYCTCQSPGKSMVWGNVNSASTCQSYCSGYSSWTCS